MSVVRVAYAIGVCMMLPVLRDPLNWAALKCERPENGERILKGLWHDQASMGKESVKS
jgi:hypothetical protein